MTMPPPPSYGNFFNNYSRIIVMLASILFTPSFIPSPRETPLSSFYVNKSTPYVMNSRSLVIALKISHVSTPCLSTSANILRNKLLLFL
jgi:hypothetical protein